MRDRLDRFNALSHVVLGVVVMVVGVTAVATPAMAATPGYRLLAADRGVFSFRAPFFGSPVSRVECSPGPMDRNELSGTCSAIAERPDGKGYWVLSGDESVVLPFGAAENLGEPWSIFRNLARYQTPVGIGIVSTPSGNGYWVAEDTGAVYGYGDAKQYGDASHGNSSQLSVNALTVAMARTPTGMATGSWVPTVELSRLETRPIWDHCPIDASCPTHPSLGWRRRAMGAVIARGC